MAEFRGKDVSWKQLWQLVSGIHYATPCEIVADKLADVANELRDGLLSKTAADATVAKVITTKTTLLAFSTSLEHYLGLSPVQASNLICSYLVNEYKGSATSLLHLLATDQQKQKLLVDIAKYCALERLVMLKVVRNLLELHTSKNHPYSGEYAAALQRLQLPVLLRSYIAQLAHLIREPPPSQQPHTVSDFSGYGAAKLVAWSERRTRETIEVLQIVLLLVEHGGIAADQLAELFALFRLHSFGRQQQHLDANNAQHVDLVNRVIYAEVVLFMRCCTDVPATGARDPQFAADVVRLLHKQMPALAQHAEHGPVLLAWMLFNFQSPGAASGETGGIINVSGIDEDQQQHQQRLRQYGSRAIQLGVFEYLHTMVRHAMYKDGSAVARIVRRTVYGQLTVLCDLFDGDGSVAQHHHVYELLAELLRTPALARDFCGREDGVRSLYQTALENFPLDFVALSGLAEAIASTGAAQQAYIRKQLENLPIYTEALKPTSTFQLKSLPDVDGDNEFVLLAPFAPFAKIDYDIVAGTTAIVQDRPFGATVHFRCTVNYFNVLHNEIDELLAEALRYTSDIDAVRERRVCAGIKYLANAVRNVSDPLRGISSEMVHPTEMVFDILTKFKAVQQPPVELLARCLEVCANLVPLFDEEIVRRVVNLNVLPFVSTQSGDYRAYCNGVGFESGLVGYYLINFEKNCGRYDFLQTYLEFLHVYAKRTSGPSNSDIELPGLIFILREILPHMHGWHFEREADRQRIYTSLFKYLLNVLQASDADGTRAVLLRNVCVDSLLNLDNGMVLLRFIAIGNDHVQSAMQNVSNWMTAAETGLNQLVQLAMTTLMQILRLRNRSATASAHPDQLSPLESIIYTQPKQRDTLRIIPVVTSYMSNIFNRRLPLLACRLLRRFAIEFQMSLLACLDMEPDQIRLTFLARLPDELESDQLKMAVIEFVEACIHKQPGLTEAFFRIRNERRFAVKADKAPRPKEIGDGILTYMTQYLCAVSAEPHRIASPLLSKILALFHALWKNNMQSLVQELQTPAEQDFWSALCKPLFCDIQPGIPAYSQLFNMLGIELFRAADGADMDASLAGVFERLLQPQCLNRWVDSVLQLPLDRLADRVPSETPEWLCRLQSFKDFIVLALGRTAGKQTDRQKPALGGCIAIPAESLRYFAERCLGSLVERAEYMEDSRPFIILAELYLMLMLSCDGKYTETAAEDDRMLVNITKLLNLTAISYREIHPRARESILAIALRAVVLLAPDLDRQPDVAVDFMRSIVEVLCLELQCTETHIIGYRQQAPSAVAAEGEDGAAAGGVHQPFVLGLNLLKQIAASLATHEQLAAHWTSELIANRILNRLLSCLNAALPVYRFRRIVAEILDVLIYLAQGACSAELLHSDIVNYLWMRLLPPKEMLQIFGAPTATSNGHHNGAERSALGLSGVGTTSGSGGAMAAGGGGGSGGGAVGEQSASAGWQTNDWWPIYARGIQLVTVLLQQHGHIFLKDALMFVGVHEEYMIDAVLLAKHTMDADAVRLIKTALLLVCELVQYEKQWRLEHASSMINLMRSVQSILDHSVSLLYRPKNLQRLMDKTPTSTLQSSRAAATGLDGANNSVQPTDELITAMNDLIEVVTICSRSLLAFSPKLIDMLVEPQFVPSQWQPLVEIQFGAPKLYVGNAPTQLTFGTVLSAASIFTKSLNLQNYQFYDTPINQLRIHRGGDEHGDIADSSSDAHGTQAASTALDRTDSGAGETANRSATRSMFTKSLSMTSTTSSAAASAPCAEILTSLDEAQCLRALEFVLTLLCSQSLLALKDDGLSVREKQLIKRELSTELAVFHDFVRKRIMCDARGPLHRKKRGVAPIRAVAGGGFEAVQPTGQTNAGERSAVAAPARHRPTMREKVIRQQHQLQTTTSATGGSPLSGALKRPTIDLSPIASGADTPPPALATKRSGQDALGGGASSSTPIVSILSSGGGGAAAAAAKRVTFPTNPVMRAGETFVVDTVDTADRASGVYDETVYVGSEDAAFTGLSLVQLVESDYLHLLSLVFMHMCQHD